MQQANDVRADRRDAQQKSRRRVEKIGDGSSHGHDTQPAINVAVL
jgi:hypothetical protein